MDRLLSAAAASVTVVIEAELIAIELHPLALSDQRVCPLAC
jgi:hypothetical protein